VNAKPPKSGVVATVTESQPPTPCPECGELCAVASRTHDLVSGAVTIYTRCKQCGRRWRTEDGGTKDGGGVGR